MRRCYTLRPGTVAEFEERLCEATALAGKTLQIGAFWHTEFGPLNQVIHVYPYDDLRQRTSVRAAMAQDTALAQFGGGGDLIAAQEAEIMNPASFMRPLGSRDYGTGNVYEMRIYTYTPGTEFARDSGFELSVPPERKAFARVASRPYSRRRSFGGSDYRPSR